MASLIRRSNGIYYELTYFHGRRIWRSSHCRRKVDALKFLASERKEVQRTPQLTLFQFEKQFLVYAETNFAPTTVLLYKQVISTFMRLIGNRNLKTYTVLDVETFKTLRLKEVSPVKVNIDFRTVKALFQTALRWELLEKNPFSGVKQIKVPPERPTYLTKEDFQRLLRAVPLAWFRDLVTFAVCTMMRSGEIVSLTWDSVDLKRRIILVENKRDFRVKTTRPRVVPMNDWVFKFLATRVKQAGFVFTFPDGRKLNVGYAGRKFKKFVRGAGLSEKIHFHSLRHTGASWLVQDGVSIYAVQKLLGHSTINVTQVYSHLETEGLFQSIERISAGLDPKEFEVILQ